MKFLALEEREDGVYSQVSQFAPLFGSLVWAQHQPWRQDSRHKLGEAPGLALEQDLVHTHAACQALRTGSSRTHRELSPRLVSSPGKPLGTWRGLGTCANTGSSFGHFSATQHVRGITVQDWSAEQTTAGQCG